MATPTPTPTPTPAPSQPGEAPPTPTPAPIPGQSQEGQGAPIEALPDDFAGGRYEVMRFLGEGGRKRVYLAKDTRLQRQVALSVIKLEGLDPTGAIRARREAEAMGRLGDHPHIVTIHDIGEDQGRLYVVSQFMAGGDLWNLLRQAEGGKLAVDQVVRIGGEIAGALEHAHSLGIIHRDIKPHNVWMTPEGTAQLGDFGLASDLGRSRLTMEGAMVGTVAYMPPEQGLGREADTRSDIYSLGALIYELLCGAPPFAGDDPVGVISQHINTPPVAPSVHRPDVPPALEQLVLSMLAKSPEQRPESATQVKEALAALSAAAEGAMGGQDLEALERLTEGTFVGREAEVGELRAAVDAVVSGRGRIVAVAGEPGMGKTRLATEISAYASLRGASVLSGRGLQDEGQPPYWPWIQVIRTYVQEHDAQTLAALMGSGASDIAQLVSEVRGRIPGLPEPPTVEPEQARFRLLDAVTSFLTNASRHKPLIVVLDDLHWADQPSLMLLQFVARTVPDSRVLILGTYRESDLEGDHPLRGLLKELARERGFSQISLGGLSRDEVGEMLEQTAQQKLESRDERALLRAVHEESEGNPYFVQEIMRHLVETGVIYQREGRWMSDVKHIEDLGIPAGIRDIVGHRLAHLSDECRHTLTLAAVIGKEFQRQTLELIVQQEDEKAAVRQHLDEALRANAIRPARDDRNRFSFTHSVMRDVLYRDFDPAERGAVHNRIGEALEEHYGDEIEPHLGEVAYHLVAGSEAGDPGKAMEFAWWAGEHSASLLAFDEAAKHFERALEVLEQLPEEDEHRRCELLIALGDARWRVGETTASKKTYRQAADVARKLDAADPFARAVLGYGGGPGGGLGVTDREDAVLIGLLRTALQLLDARDSVLRVRLISRLAVELYFTDESEERDRLGKEAIEMAERIGEPSIYLLALYSRQWASLGPDELETQLETADEIIKRARALGDREMEFSGHHFRLDAQLQLGEAKAVDREVAACKRLADELRQPYYLWQAEVFRAMRPLLEGRYEVADEIVQEALSLGRHGHEETALVLFSTQTFFVGWGKGTLAELAEGGDALAERYPRSAFPAALTLIQTEAGLDDKAKRGFREFAKGGFGNIRRDGNWLTALACLSFTAYYLKDRKAAERLHHLLAPYADRQISILTGAACFGSTHQFLGLLSATLERWDDAIQHFEQALEVNERMHAFYVEPRVRLWLAETLLAREADGDPEAALVQIERGLDVARDLSMPSHGEKLLALKLKTQGLALPDVATSIEAVARSVEVDRPDLRPAAAPDGTVTVMFSDIQDSTMLAEKLGDKRWMELLRVHNTMITGRALEHGGYEVKNQGDGFMLAFASALRGIQCAIEIQRAFAVYSEEHPDQPLLVRVGLHTGEVVRDQDDFFGRNVIMAARIASQAEGSEILVSSLMRELVVSSGEVEFGDAREVELKGLTGMHKVFGVRWAETASVSAEDD